MKLLAVENSAEPDTGQGSDRKRGRVPAWTQVHAARADDAKHSHDESYETQNPNVAHRIARREPRGDVARGDCVDTSIG